MKNLLRVASALLISIVSLGAVQVQAQASESWLPSFDSSQHVYIAPAVQGSVRTDFAIGDFKSELADAARKQNLDVYVIVTRSEADAGAVNGSGPVLVRKLWDNWHGSSSFSSQRALVILMTGGSDGKLVSVGVRAGETLNNLGIVRNTMSDPNGPVMPVLRSDLSGNPSAVPVKIVNNISAIIAAKSGNSTAVTGDGAGTAPAISNSSEEESSMPIALIFIVGGIVVAAIVILVMRANRKPAQSSSGNVFEDRLRSSSRKPSGSGDSVSDGSVKPSGSESSTARDATILGAGALGGYVLGSEVQRRRDEERRRDSGTPSSSTTNDTPYVAPASNCSTPTTPSTPASSCSAPSSSCGGGGSSCGGGGSSCGGGS